MHQSSDHHMLNLLTNLKDAHHSWSHYCVFYLLCTIVLLMDISSDSFLKFYHSKVRVTSAYASRILQRKIDLAYNMTISACGIMILLCCYIILFSKQGQESKKCFNSDSNDSSFSTFNIYAFSRRFYPKRLTREKQKQFYNQPMLYTIPLTVLVHFQLKNSSDLIALSFWTDSN